MNPTLWFMAGVAFGMGCGVITSMFLHKSAKEMRQAIDKALDPLPGPAYPSHPHPSRPDFQPTDDPCIWPAPQRPRRIK